MVSPSIFKKHKCDTESLKGYFTADPPKKAKKQDSDSKDGKDKRDDKPPIERLKELIRDRIKDGRTRSLKDYRTWAAVDLAYDAPFHQETPTIIRAIMDGGGNAQKVLEQCRSWGLREGDLFVKGEKEGDPMELNVSIFSEVLVPVVRAYLTVRLAKIFNDRNLDPLFKYIPRRMTEVNRVRCEIITDMVQVMAQQFGYSENLKQMIFNALMYSVCLEFPVEPWTCDKQEGENGKEVVVREGVRYVAPHITRLIYDQQYSLATFNTDTGNTFAGYWSISRWGEIENNKHYWNINKVSYGYDWLSKEAPYRNYFEQAYPCTLLLPTVVADDKTTDRETIANTYTNTDYDKAVFVTHMFMKLIPADWGMGTYKHAIWFRFIIASDDTVIYAEPFPYTPVTYAPYDPDQNRGKNASLALEIIPTQDLLGNILTQILMTIKRNLANIVFYDSNMVDAGQAKLLAKRSQWQYQAINLIPYDSVASARAGADPRATFHEVKFSYADTSVMFQSIPTVISLLERLLGISAQEIGSAASHQQSKAEVQIIQTNTTNRVAYTASGIDSGIDAKKRQLFEAAIAYKDAEVIAQVSSDTPNLEAILKELGFTAKGKTMDGKKTIVSGKKEKLQLDGFASTVDGPDRVNDVPTAQAMFQAIASINQNPSLAAILDPESIARLIENAAKFAGADDDFVLKLNKNGAMAQQLQMLAQDLAKQIQEATMKQVATDIAKPAAEAVHEQEQKIEVLEQQTAQISKTLEQINKMVMQMAASAPPLQPPTALDATQLQPAPVAAAPELVGMA